jgi:hypothetical protein
MSVRQAQSFCPEVSLESVDFTGLQAVQDALLETLAAWQLPVEENGWGKAYLDLHTVATMRDAVQPLAIDLGREVRQKLGDGLQPALGWDSGKFTAYAAATIARPGHMRLVSREDEQRFLAPFSISLLPLSPDDQHRLKLLGIKTLGEFARLPAASVFQQFGDIGCMAQRWAQGHDPRPVRSLARQAFESLSVDIDPPTGLLEPVLTALLDLMGPQLKKLALELSGCWRLQLKLNFITGDRRDLLIAFVSPIVQPSSLRLSLVHHLQSLIWPGELSHVTITGLETGELPALQLALLPEINHEENDPGYYRTRIQSVYGPVFVRPTVPEPTHPVGPLRSAWLPA